jgi:hypothetical protein
VLCFDYGKTGLGCSTVFHVPKLGETRRFGLAAVVCCRSSSSSRQQQLATLAANVHASRKDNRQSVEIKHFF